MTISKQTSDTGRGKESSTVELSEQELKFKEIQEYIPYLETIILNVGSTDDEMREAKVLKLRILHALLTNPKKKLKIETLVKCEEVLKKLKEKLDQFPGIKKSSYAGTK